MTFKEILNLKKESESSIVVQTKQIKDVNTLTVYEDSAIAKKYPYGKAETIEDEESGRELEIRFCNGKAVILQQGPSGCTAAVTAMLIRDAGKTINIQSVFNCINENNKQMREDLENANFTFVEKRISSVIDLQDNLPAIVAVTISGNHGHVVILDEIGPDFVTIRDPYHGWMVDIKKRDFEDTLSKTENAICDINHLNAPFTNISKSIYVEKEPKRRYPPEGKNLNEVVIQDEGPGPESINSNNSNYANILGSLQKNIDSDDGDHVNVKKEI